MLTQETVKKVDHLDSITPVPNICYDLFFADFCQLQQLCFKKPLCEKLLTIERVEIPRAIQVTIPQTLKKNTLKYYFNNEKRSGGKNVTNVTLYKDDGCAVIGFQDPKGNALS